MGNAEAKNKLYMAITANDPETARNIIKKYPSVMNGPISDDLKTTALTRAAYLNRPHIIACLSELGADLNSAGVNGISALMWAAARGHVDCLQTLLNCGADPSKTGPHEMNAADFAILYGRYEAAWFLSDRGCQSTRSAEDFAAIRETMDTLWVDFPGMLMSLQCKIPAEVAPPFTVPPPVKKVILEDPVPDPDESWKEWFNRVVDFEEPPLIERRSLPAEKQPQNKLSGKVKILIGIDRPPRPVEDIENQPRDQ